MSKARAWKHTRQTTHPAGNQLVSAPTCNQPSVISHPWYPHSCSVPCLLQAAICQRECSSKCCLINWSTSGPRGKLLKEDKPTSGRHPLGWISGGSSYGADKYRGDQPKKWWFLNVDHGFNRCPHFSALESQFGNYTTFSDNPAYLNILLERVMDNGCIGKSSLGGGNDCSSQSSFFNKTKPDLSLPAAGQDIYSWSSSGF